MVGHVALHAPGARDTMALAARHTDREPDALAVVARVLVQPDGTRRAGVAHALLDTAVPTPTERHRAARPRGGHPARRGAIGLYESCGWERVGEVTIELPGEPGLQSLRLRRARAVTAQGPDPLAVTRR